MACIRHRQSLLIGAAAAFDCKLAHYYRFGSHTLFIGTVTRIEMGEGSTLVYHDRSYCSVSRVN